MKKFLYLLIYSVLFLLLSIGVTVVSDLFAFSSAWYPLIIAFALLIITTVFSRVFSKSLKTLLHVFTALNSIALGFSIRAWYIFREFNTPFGTLIWVALVSIAVFVLFYLISYIPFVSKHYGLFFFITTLVIVAGYIVTVHLLETDYVSTLGFYMIFTWCVAICLFADMDDDSFKTCVLLSSFSVWLVSLIILAIMGGGDVFDLDFGGSPKKISSKGAK